MASAKSDRGMSIMKENEIVIFETKDKEVKLNVKVGTDTVWLSRNQMADLFDRDVKTIGKHINNALKEELDNSTVAYFATVQNEGGRNVERDIEYGIPQFSCLHQNDACKVSEKQFGSVVLSDSRIDTIG